MKKKSHKMRFMKNLAPAVCLFFVTAGMSHSAHPLITDDTGTQGKGKSQLEVNGEFSHAKTGAATEDVVELSTALSHGLSDTVDIVVGVPYQRVTLKEDGNKTSNSGIGDIAVELKMRLYEKDGLSFALKPGVTVPTGDDERGLGAGKMTYSVFAIATKEAEPWAFHVNLGYIRNENRAAERENLWHASLAASVEVAKDLNIVANIGMERNAAQDSNTHPAFVLGGLIYSLSDSLDLDFGVKAGLNESEADYAVLAGLAWKF